MSLLCPTLSALRAGPSRTRGGLLVAGLLLLATTGCAGVNLFPFGDKEEEMPLASSENPVVQLVPIWQVGDGRGIDERTTRGFEGQIYFITKQKSAPARVEGHVRIYLFDDQGTPEQQAKPIHQFDFGPEVWKYHLRKSALGPTYGVFIPYVRKGIHQAQCSLRVRFTPTDGRPIFSEMLRVTLPGLTKEQMAAAKETKAEQAALDEEAQAEAAETDPAPKQVRRPALKPQPVTALDLTEEQDEEAEPAPIATRAPRSRQTRQVADRDTSRGQILRAAFEAAMAEEEPIEDEEPRAPRELEEAADAQPLDAETEANPFEEAAAMQPARRTSAAASKRVRLSREPLPSPAEEADSDHEIVDHASAFENEDAEDVAPRATGKPAVGSRTNPRPHPLNSRLEDARLERQSEEPEPDRHPLSETHEEREDYDEVDLNSEPPQRYLSRSSSAEVRTLVSEHTVNRPTHRTSNALKPVSKPKSLGVMPVKAVAHTRKGEPSRGAARGEERQGLETFTIPLNGRRAVALRDQTH